MLGLTTLALGYSGLAARPALTNVRMAAISPGDIGTTKPLGVYDPLGLIGNDPVKYRRWQEMEIKHGRFAMAATLHVILTEVRAATRPRHAPRLAPLPLASATIDGAPRSPPHPRREVCMHADSRRSRTGGHPLAGLPVPGRGH